MRGTTFRSAVFPLFCGLAVSTLVAAQSAPGQDEARSDDRGFALQEITVTARRREESLKSTPIAVTAVSAAELDERGVTQIDAVSQFAPNVNFSFAGTSSGSSSAAVVFIRGVGQNDFVPTTEPGVGTYVDGVYYGRTVGSVLDLLDLERVEVLRGPQGTLFGRNTIGGAINITSRKPGNELAGDLRGTVGTDDRRDFFGRVDLPVSDSLRAGAAFLSRNRDGYVARADGVDLGDDDVLGARVNLVWDVSSAVEAWLTLDGVREREESAPEVLLDARENGTFPTFFNNNQFGNGSTSPACRGGGSPSNPACYNDQFVRGPFASGETGPSRSDVDAWGTALNLTFDVSDALSVKSITAYRELDAELARAPDGSPFTIFSSEDVYTQDQLSQELQLLANALNGRVNIVSGIYYFTENAEDFGTIRLVPPTSPLLVGGVVDNDNYAFFSEVTFNLTDRLHLLGGARYTKEEKSYLATSLRGNDGVPRISVLSGDAAREQTLDDNRVTWRASLSYDFLESLTGYVTASTGFKSGGFSLRITEPNTSIPRFGPEFVDLYEIGLKMERPESGLRFNAAVFYSDYTDIQLDGVIPGAFGTVTFNGGDAEIRGIETEVDWVPTRSVKLFGSVGYLDAEYKSLNPGSLVRLSDELIRAPEWTASGGFSYLLDFGGNGTLTPRLDVTYKSETQFEPVNTPLAVEDGYTALNLNVPYVSSGGDWRINLGVENLTDEEYLISADSNPAIGYDVGVYARPRNWSLTVQKSF